MDEMMKVGELARRTGLSVRALHHYDEIGLLHPARRTAAGHRLYGRGEVERLQRIASLRQLDLSLEEIGACLSRPEYSLDRVLELQIQRIDQEIDGRRRLRRLIQELRDRSRSGEASLDDITRTIEVTTMFEKYYTPEQLKQLEQRAAMLGQERIEESQRDWQELGEAFAAAMERGLDPASDEVQALARKSAALIEEFTGGDPGIAQSLADMYRSEGPEKVLEGRGMPMAPGLWEYMGRARAALTGEE